jgi:hypothetical protein
MNAKEFYQNPQKWGNEEWDRIKPNTFTVSEMIDFAEAYHKEKMKGYHNDFLERVDDFLAGCEDWMKGEEGEEVTDMRGIISKLTSNE